MKRQILWQREFEELPKEQPCHHRRADGSEADRPWPPFTHHDHESGYRRRAGNEKAGPLEQSRHRDQEQAAAQQEHPALSRDRWRRVIVLVGLAIRVSVAQPVCKEQRRQRGEGYRRDVGHGGRGQSETWSGLHRYPTRDDYEQKHQSEKCDQPARYNVGCFHALYFIPLKYPC